MREYFRFTSPLSPLSRHSRLAAASANRSVRCRKFEEWNANFQSTTTTFLIVGRISIFQHLTQYQQCMRIFTSLNGTWSKKLQKRHADRDSNHAANFILSVKLTFMNIRLLAGSIFFLFFSFFFKRRFFLPSRSENAARLYYNNGKIGYNISY